MGGSSHRVIVATLAALGSSAVLPACDRDKPATEVPAGTTPPPSSANASASVRVPDGIEPLTAAQEAEREREGPTDEELQMMLDSDEFPALLEGTCGAEASCAGPADATCGVDSGP